MTGDRAAASQQRVLELMHRVSGYTLRVPFHPGRLLASLAVLVVRFPRRVAAAGDANYPDFMVTRQQVFSFTRPHVA